MKQSVVCSVCFRHCSLEEGRAGVCRVRKNNGGTIRADNYGKLTALALDPIEKKPLALFYPGSMILSAGSYGCNLFCPFCQNYEISQADNTIKTDAVLPEELADQAEQLRLRGNIGVAYTYNEPLVGWEYVRDTARIVHQRGMKNVVVTNGCVSPEVFSEVLPYIDAMNIDLKCFTKEGYEKLGGDLDMVKAGIVQCAARCHVELTTLIVPGFNDSAGEIDMLAAWVASAAGKGTALHITRFFPRWHMENAEPTPVKTIYSLASVAHRHLLNIFTGNC
jgi:pyruvate formate lyase activating enzyme